MAKAKTPAVDKPASDVNPNNVQMWREIAKALVPKEKDDWRVGEIALAQQMFAGLIQKAWPDITHYANRHDKVSLSLKLIIDRKETPPTVKLRISGATEGIDETAESVVPDPAQTELPGMEDEPAAET